MNIICALAFNHIRLLGWTFDNASPSGPQALLFSGVDVRFMLLWTTQLQ